MSRTGKGEFGLEGVVLAGTGYYWLLEIGDLGGYLGMPAEMGVLRGKYGGLEWKGGLLFLLTNLYSQILRNS